MWKQFFENIYHFNIRIGCKTFFAWNVKKFTLETLHFRNILAHLFRIRSIFILRKLDLSIFLLVTNRSKLCDLFLFSTIISKYCFNDSNLITFINSDRE